MKSVFLVDKRENYERKFDCVVKEDGIIRVLNEDEIYELKENEEKFVIEFKFKSLNSAENRDILSRTISLLGDDIKIDVASFNDQRMRAVLVDWNLVDEEGEKLSINNRNLDELHPSISNRMVSIINETLGLDMSAG